MSSDLNPYGQPLRRFPGHYAAAVVATACALAMQVAWLEIGGRLKIDSWWPLDAVLVAAATGYLLALAELHLRAATWRPNELVPRLWLLGRALGANLTIGVFVLIIAWRGSNSCTLRAGLWMVPAALLAAMIASPLTIGLAFRDGWSRLTTDVPPQDAPRGQPRSELVHGLLAVGLVLALYTIEQFEPKYAPPPAIPRPAAATSPAADRTLPATSPASPRPPVAN
jgi:hypothetical protein